MKNAITRSLEEKELLLLDNGEMVARQNLIQAIFESINDAEVCTLLASFCTDEPGTFDENAIVENVEFDSPFSGFSPRASRDPHISDAETWIGRTNTASSMLFFGFSETVVLSFSARSRRIQ